MIIGIDCTEIKTGFKGGISAFTFGLIDGLVNKGQKHQFVIFATTHNQTLFKKYQKINNFKIIVISNYISIIKNIFNLIFLLIGSEYLYIRTNNFFTVNLPLNLKNGSYWIAGTFNSIVNTDQLENERPDSLFISQASTMRLLSLAFGARYKGDQKFILNISNFINNHKELGKTQLNSVSITRERPLIKDKINLSGTLSFLSSSGVSEFSNYGLSLGSTIIISQDFKLNLATLTMVLKCQINQMGFKWWGSPT